MAKSLNESLFLLEILIDKIVYCKAPCCPEKDFKTTVTFEFLCVDPIEITDTSTGSCSAKCGGPFIKIFNTGKSCLFSLKEADIKKAMCNFSIKVTITKSLMCSCLPAKMNMGSCAIDMTKEFVQARKKYLENPVSGCHQSLRDNFRLVACDGSKTGDILLFLRISCFGKHIVTKFDASQTQGTLKTADQPSSTDRIERLCPAGKTCQSAKDPCACGAEAPPGACGAPHRRRLEAADCDDQFPKPEYQAPLECRNTDPYCLHVPKGTVLTSSTLEVLAKNEILPFNRSNPAAAPVSFGSQKYPVYISLVEQYGGYVRVSESGTQATGFLNKCLQIHVQRQNYMKHLHQFNDINDSSAKCKSIKLPFFQEYFPRAKTNSSRIFFENSKLRAEKNIEEETISHKITDCIDKLDLMKTNRREITVANMCCPKKTKGFFSSLFKGAGTQVNECSPCCERKTTFAATANDKEDSCSYMLGTISHIRIGPPPPCPAHGTTCTGLCNFKGVKILPNEERARMKVSTASNSRRGVFELAVRKLTGAPIARNELLLEWTPPTSCGSPCALPCSRPGSPYCSSPSCNSVKCKMIVCKPNSDKPLRKLSCSQPCHPPPCQPGCRASCRSKPCVMCKPCVRSLSPPPCRRPSKKPCPSKCTRVCSVGRGKLRKKSVVKIRPHPQHKSPCLNRKPECPVIRAHSQPGNTSCRMPSAPRLCRSTARCSGCRHPC